MSLQGKPAVFADQPLRGGERAAREHRAIADRVRELNRLRRPIETNGMRAGHRSDARRRHVDRPIVAGALHARLDRQRRPRRRVLLHRVMRFVNPGAELGMLREVTARLFDGQLEHVHAEREIRRREHADAGVRRRSSRIAASCACQPVVPITTLIFRSASCGRFFGTASASVKSIATSTSPNVPSAIARCSGMLVDHAGHGGAVRRGQRFHQLPHPAVAEQQDAHQAALTAREELVVNAAEAGGQVGFANHEGDVAARRRLRHHPQRHVADRRQHAGRPAPDRRAARRRPRRRSPCGLRARPAQIPTAPRRSPAAAAHRRWSPTR